MWCKTSEPKFHGFSRNIRLGLLSLTCAASVVAASYAQAGTPGPLHLRDLPGMHRSPYQAVSNDTVNLMTAIIQIESDLLLGQLFMHDGLVHAEGSHFTHPRKETLPQIKDALAALGAPDLESLLIALEQAKDVKEADAAYIAALTGLKKTKELVAPTGHDVLEAVILAAEAAHGILDPSGTTAAAEYQEAWGLLTAARGELDALAFSSDPAVKQSAAKMVLAFDEVVLLAPDPAAKAPVQFDPALVAQMIETLKGQLQSI